MESTTTETFSIGEQVVVKSANDYFRNTPIVVIVLWMILPVFGIVTNAINVKTFTAIGIEDGVSVSLLTLSISDFSYSLASFVLGGALVATKLEARHRIVFPIDPFAFIINIYSTAVTVAFAVTGMTTVFLAVARCICVAKPLHFKGMFTKSRSIVIHSIFVFLSVSIYYTSVLSLSGTSMAYDKSVNRTRRVFWLSAIREEVKDAVFFLFDFVLAFMTLVVMIVCVFVMGKHLAKSTKFQRTSKAIESEGGRDSTHKLLSGKELQVVKQIVLISSMFILCSIPKTFISVYGLTNKEFALGRSQMDLYYDMHFVRNAFEIFNAASTLFVYYNFNSKFRDRLTKDMCCN